MHIIDDLTTLEDSKRTPKVAEQEASWPKTSIASDEKAKLEAVEISKISEERAAKLEGVVAIKL